MVVRKVLLPDFVPDVFLRTELRRVGGQQDQADVVGDLQGHRLMRTRPIHHHDDVVAGVACADLLEESAHLFCVYFITNAISHLALRRAYWVVLGLRDTRSVGQETTETLRTSETTGKSRLFQFPQRCSVLQWLIRVSPKQASSQHGPVHVCELPFITVFHDGSCAGWRTTPAGARHPAEASLVLKHQSGSFSLFFRLSQDFGHHFREFISSPPAWPYLPSQPKDAETARPLRGSSFADASLRVILWFALTGCGPPPEYRRCVKDSSRWQWRFVPE
jgi:hypothetical protein